MTRLIQYFILIFFIATIGKSQITAINDLGIDTPPPDNQTILISSSSLHAAWNRSQSMDYENTATNLGCYIFDSNCNGSPIEPPILCAWQSKMIINIIDWRTPPIFITSPEICISESVNWATNAAIRYPGILYWQFINEPFWGINDKCPWFTNDQDFCAFYVAGTKAVGAALKKINPKIKILGPTLAKPFSAMNTTMVNAGICNVIDYWDFHDYRLVQYSPLVNNGIGILTNITAQLVGIRKIVPRRIPFIVDECGIGDYIIGTNGLWATINKADINGWIQPYLAAGCVDFNVCGLWGTSFTSQSNSNNLGAFEAGFNLDGTMKQKTISLLNILLNK